MPSQFFALRLSFVAFLFASSFAPLLCVVVRYVVWCCVVLFCVVVRCPLLPSFLPLPRPSSFFPSFAPLPWHLLLRSESRSSLFRLHRLSLHCFALWSAMSHFVVLLPLILFFSLFYPVPLRTIAVTSRISLSAPASVLQTMFRRRYFPGFRSGSNRAETVEAKTPPPVEFRSERLGRGGKESRKEEWKKERRKQRKKEGKKE